MRVVAAAVFVVGGMLLAAAVLFASGLADRLPPMTVGLGLGLLLLVLSVVALVLFNALGSDPLHRLTAEEHLVQLKQMGLVASTDFKARRAFRVAESDDEGPHYFLELDDGRVLYLNGQYLYEYEPIEGDPEVNQPRRFPCTEFSACRHRTEGYVVDLVCKGVVIEPECTATASKRVWKLIGSPDDGQILPDRPYDFLKEMLLECT